MNSSKAATVLVAEDDENDLFLLRRAFEKAGLSNPIVDVPNGEAAINYLSDSEHNALPALFLLDLKMPLLNGFDVLSWLQQRPELKSLPTVVLSASSFDSDIKRACELGARAYLIKPQRVEDLVKLVQELSLRWLAAREGTSARMLRDFAE